LFRSAALAHGPRVVGVILSGGLDDGSVGLWAIKTRGGIAIVQDPDEATTPSMPWNAMRRTRVDHCLRMAEIPAALAGLAVEPSAEADTLPAPSEDLEIETRIAMEENPLQAGLAALGPPSMFTCPECHGVLIRLQTGGLRFRCHTGHAFTANALLAELTESIEDDIWNVVRSVEESSLLMEHMAGHARSAGDERMAAALERKASKARIRAESLRRAGLEHEALSGDIVADAEGPVPDSPATDGDSTGPEPVPCKAIP
jgi:two-component system chemotaxis response regulator CheB